MIYITLLDQFHPGIYSSQVIDVCDYLNKFHKTKIRVVAFLSIRELLKTDARKRLKKLSPNAIVLPAFPGLKNFQFTSILLFWVCLFTGERIAICRNVFCTKMTLRLKRWGMIKKVVMDGRSAMAAEIGEYDVFPVDYLRKNVSTFESFAVNNSDYRMAVSQKLIEYWREHYNYTGNDHVVIPCTLDRKHFANDNFVLSETSLQLKVEMGISDTDIVLGYSGSTAPWQSFELLEKILVPLMDRDERIKVMFLSKTNKDNEQLRSKYKDRVIIKWVEHGEVLDHLACCDYGILLREQSDTNKVASPTKFAEYLYAGLPVLISENLGDFSEYVKTNDCGSVVYMNEPDWSFLKKNGIEVKKKCFEYAKRDFLKTSNDNTEAYKKLVEVLK